MICFFINCILFFAEGVITSYFTFTPDIIPDIIIGCTSNPPVSEVFNNSEMDNINPSMAPEELAPKEPAPKRINISFNERGYVRFFIEGEKTPEQYKALTILE